MGGRGMSEINKEALISMIREGRYHEAVAKIVSEEQIMMPSDTLKLLARYAKKAQEHFIIISLDGAHKPIRTRVITIGLVNKTMIHSREVYRQAIKDNAVAVILAHNHPSGNIEPSLEDIEITRRLKDAGETIGIQVLDHVIIGKFGSYSFAEHGLITQSRRD
jgi:DNA repair protein RadC